MAVTISEVEAIPAAYPDVPLGLSDAAKTVNGDTLWHRIEAYIGHRFTTREVVWTIEGLEGADWTAPLSPVTSLTAEKWESDAWVAVTLPEGPLGYVLPSDGVFKVTAQVGAGDVPAAVSEAFKRLAEYVGGARGSTDEPGATRSSFKIGSELDFTVERYPSWQARAMQYSGAADLLRNYRRSK